LAADLGSLMMGDRLAAVVRAWLNAAFLQRLTRWFNEDSPEIKNPWKGSRNQGIARCCNETPAERPMRGTA
jgi:hypothetical protein